MLGILILFAALALWLLVLVVKGMSKTFYALGVGIMLFLNTRYFFEGASSSIAFFVGIYDVVNNIGLEPGADNKTLPGGMGTCPDNACSVWNEDEYSAHTFWTIAFYQRFALTNEPELLAWRYNLLVGHIVFQTAAFVLMHVQLLYQGRSWHKWLGRICFLCTSLGSMFACTLAWEFDAVPEYGGIWAKWGFIFLALCTWIPAAVGSFHVRNGNKSLHRVWMFRFAGALYGAYWVFRLGLFVLDPALREYPTVALLFVTWVSGPAGIIAGETVRRRMDYANSGTKRKQVKAH